MTRPETIQRASPSPAGTRGTARAVDAFARTWNSACTRSATSADVLPRSAHPGRARTRPAGRGGRPRLRRDRRAPPPRLRDLVPVDRHRRRPRADLPDHRRQRRDRAVHRGPRARLPAVHDHGPALRRAASSCSPDAARSSSPTRCSGRRWTTTTSSTTRRSSCSCGSTRPSGSRGRGGSGRRSTTPWCSPARTASTCASPSRPAATRSRRCAPGCSGCPSATRSSAASRPSSRPWSTSTAAPTRSPGTPPPRRSCPSPAWASSPTDGKAARDFFYPYWLESMRRISSERGFPMPNRISYESQAARGGAYFVGEPEQIAERIVALHGVLAPRPAGVPDGPVRGAAEGVAALDRAAGHRRSRRWCAKPWVSPSGPTRRPTSPARRGSGRRACP